MKQIFFIDDTTENKICFYLLACFLVVLPYDFFYSELILISFGLHTLIHVKKENVKRIFGRTVLIPVSLYGLGLVAMVYSPDVPEAIHVATRQLAILLFPLLFALSNIDLEKYKMNLVSIFGFSCTCTILYLYVDALQTILHFNLPFSSLFGLLFMNHSFSLPIGIHATYLSLYIAFSLVVFLYLLLSGRHMKHRWLYVIAAIILFAGLLQLSSRAVFIAFLIILNGVFPFRIFHGRKRIQFLLTASIVSAGLLLLIYNVDSFKTRYISELKTDLTNQVKIIENSEPRLARWNVILELVKKSPVIGYGSGSEVKLLKEKYFEKGMYNSYLQEFNAHNQYLSILIKTGIIGLLLFGYILYFGFALATRERGTLFLCFMVMIAVVSFSENILDLNKGIFFYAFFFSLFLWKKRIETGKK